MEADAIRLWMWTRDGLEACEGLWPSLDAQSLALPNGVYTTLRTYGGRRIVGLGDHLERLAESLRLIGGCALDLGWLRLGMRQVIIAAAFPETRLRVTVPPSCAPVWFGVERFVLYPQHLYAVGARCRQSPLTRTTPRAKTTRFIAPASAARASLAPGIHELLLVHRQGHILEGSSSNFFAVLDGELRTAGEDVLAGVTRGIVLDLARSLLAVREQPISVGDLSRATEAFITSSSREVMPVVEVDGQPIADGQPGPITRELARLYREHLLDLAEEP